MHEEMCSTPSFLVAATYEFEVTSRHSEADAMLREKSQSPKTTYCMTPFTLSVPNSEIQRQITGYLGLGLALGYGLATNGYRVSFGGNNNVLKFDYSN